MENYEFTEIAVPDMNDSVSRLKLRGIPYNIRFTWNDTGKYWKFGLYDDLLNPLVLGLKIVPMFTLNLFFGARKTPNLVFGVKTKNDRVGREDFKNGTAHFLFVPWEGSNGN